MPIVHNTSANPLELRHSHAQRWLLAYDICDPRRLGKVCRYLSKEATRLQFSIYLLTGNRAQVEPIIQNVKNLMDAKHDDVRIYPVTSSTRIWGLGIQFSDQGVVLCDDFFDKLLVPETNKVLDSVSMEP